MTPPCQAGTLRPTSAKAKSLFPLPAGGVNTAFGRYPERACSDESDKVRALGVGELLGHRGGGISCWRKK